MAYQIKSIKYHDAEVRILLQNENGPCPLIAAANILLLRQSIELPSHCIRNSVVSLEDLNNMLANYAMTTAGTEKKMTPNSTATTTTVTAIAENDEKFNNDDNGDKEALAVTSTDDNDDEAHLFIVQEMLQHIPNFQRGMDVNLKFTEGIMGYEYTAQLSALDLWRVVLVHGWLVDPIHEEETYALLKQLSYNQVLERIITGTEASAESERLVLEISELEDRLRQAEQNVDLLNNDMAELEQLQRTLIEARERQIRLQHSAMEASIMQDFLNSSCHQLTPYGLQVLHETLEEGQLAMFFRNNHFGTITKHTDGHLYLLVTDLGYSNTPAVVWEKLDVIDGDTEYVNSQFRVPGAQTTMLAPGPSLSPEQLLAQSSQHDADYHLALQLSMQDQHPQTGNHPQANLDEQEGRLMAAATEASLREYHGLDSGMVEPQRELRIEVGIPVTPPDGEATGSAAVMTAKASTTTANDRWTTQEEADRMLAMQLQTEQGSPDDTASFHLAQLLQAEENSRVAATNRARPEPGPIGANRTSPATASNCVIQ